MLSMTFPIVTELLLALEPLTADGFAVVVDGDSQSNVALTVAQPARRRIVD